MFGPGCGFAHEFGKTMGALGVTTIMADECLSDPYQRMVLSQVMKKELNPFSGEMERENCETFPAFPSDLHFEDQLSALQMYWSELTGSVSAIFPHDYVGEFLEALIVYPTLQAVGKAYNIPKPESEDYWLTLSHMFHYLEDVLFARIGISLPGSKLILRSCGRMFFPSCTCADKVLALSEWM